MKKHLIIFGSEGSLGKASKGVFLKENYDNYYFFDRKYAGDIDYEGNLKRIKISDLSIEENVAEAFSKIVYNENDKYFLFCTIGGFAGGKLLKDTDYEEWLLMQKINLNIPFLIGKHFFRFASGTKGGAICFTSAYGSLNPAEKIISYGSSKNSLNYFVKTFAKEASSFGLKVNAVAPSIIKTDENKKWVKDQSKMIRPAKIAGLVNKVFMEDEYESGSIISIK